MARKKLKTIDLKGSDYAKVAERVKEFREACPHGLIKTRPIMRKDGSILFKVTILRDKSDPNSAEATGHALGQNSGAKAFEKLETIAVGRALAMLGYGADGEIASAEEMEDFLDYQKGKKESMILTSKEKLEDVKNFEELKMVWADLPIEAKAELEGLKDKLKKKFDKGKPKAKVTTKKVEKKK